MRKREACDLTLPEPPNGLQLQRVTTPSWSLQTTAPIRAAICVCQQSAFQCICPALLSLRMSYVRSVKIARRMKPIER